MTNEQVDRDDDHEDTGDFLAVQKHSKGKGSAAGVTKTPHKKTKPKYVFPVGISLAICPILHRQPMIQSATDLLAKLKFYRTRTYRKLAETQGPGAELR
jgi:hypothetical protein